MEDLSLLGCKLRSRRVGQLPLFGCDADTRVTECNQPWYAPRTRLPMWFVGPGPERPAGRAKYEEGSSGRFISIYTFSNLASFQAEEIKFEGVSTPSNFVLLPRVSAPPSSFVAYRARSELKFSPTCAQFSSYETDNGPNKPNFPQPSGRTAPTKQRMAPTRTSANVGTKRGHRAAAPLPPNLLRLRQAIGKRGESAKNRNRKI